MGVLYDREADAIALIGGKWLTKCASAELRKTPHVIRYIGLCVAKRCLASTDHVFTN